MNWRGLDKFPQYAVSDDGLIFSYWRMRLMRPGVNSRGYRVVRLVGADGKKTCLLLHRLIAETFCQQVPGKNVVDHINGDKTDNRAENLRWVTQKENMCAALNMRKLRTSEKTNTSVRVAGSRYRQTGGIPAVRNASRKKRKAGASSTSNGSVLASA